MKAFTVYQPYAQAIVRGLKEFETRPRRTHIRGRIAIHAGLKSPYSLPWFTYERLKALETLFADDLGAEGSLLRLPRGVVVGTAELADCLPCELVAGSISETEKLLGDFSPGRFAYQLRNVVLFEHPVPAIGKRAGGTGRTRPSRFPVFRMSEHRDGTMCTIDVEYIFFHKTRKQRGRLFCDAVLCLKYTICNHLAYITRNEQQLDRVWLMEWFQE